LKGLRILRFGIWGVIGGLSAMMLVLLMQPPRETGSGVAMIGGPFSLTTHEGVRISDQSLKGKPFALFFGFTHCPDICPTSMLEITNDLNALKDVAAEFKVYFVTVDPERDTPALLKEYLGSFDPRIIGLIAQNEAELNGITKAYRAIYRKVPTPSSYTMDHTAAIYLMDGRGQFFGTLDSKESPQIRQTKLRRLLAKG
jgi:protein SCO1